MFVPLGVHLMEDGEPAIRFSITCTRPTTRAAADHAQGGTPGALPADPARAGACHAIGSRVVSPHGIRNRLLPHS